MFSALLSEISEVSLPLSFTFSSLSNSTMSSSKLSFIKIKLCKTQQVTITPEIASTFLISRNFNFLNLPFNKPNERLMTTLVELWAALNSFALILSGHYHERVSITYLIRGMLNLPIDGTYLGDSGEHHEEGYS